MRENAGKYNYAGKIRGKCGPHNSPPLPSHHREGFSCVRDFAGSWKGSSTKGKEMRYIPQSQPSYAQSPEWRRGQERDPSTTDVLRTFRVCGNPISWEDKRLTISWILLLHQNLGGKWGHRTGNGDPGFKKTW